MKNLSLPLLERQIVYVTRDIERALGLPQDTPGYFIISNLTPFGKTVAEANDLVLLISGDRMLDTHELLSDSGVANKINSHMPISILVFKNTGQIEKICARQGWKLLNPAAELAARIEEKISQVVWLGDLKKFLPPHRIDLCKNIAWTNQPFILQFNRAHTGSGTFYIESERQLAALRKKFPDRPARITDYITGTMLTNNNIVTKEKILIGNLSAQLTGLAPFTDNPFATVGNDWNLPNMMIPAKQKKAYSAMAKAVGEKLRADGWRGLFGIDAMIEKRTGKLYLIEVNARQPASTTYESALQERKKCLMPRKKLLTAFEAHLFSLLEVEASGYSLAPIADGAQIIVRNPLKKSEYPTKKINEWKDALEREGFHCISYENSTPGADRLRIQSETGIMDTWSTFNKHGKRIIECLK